MKNPKLAGMDVRYGGRLVRFEILVNTDAPEDVVQQRLLQLQRVARGARRDMAVASASVIPDATSVWWDLIRAAREKVEGES